MIWLHCKLRGKERYYEPIDDVLCATIYIVLSIITLAAAEGIWEKGGIVLAIAVGIIGVGIIVASVSAIVCKWFEYLEEAKRIEAECIKYEVSERLKYGRYRMDVEMEE